MSELLTDVLDLSWWHQNAIGLLVANVFLLVGYRVLKLTIQKMPQFFYLSYIQLIDGIDGEAQNLAESPALHVARWGAHMVLWAIGCLLAIGVFVSAVVAALTLESSSLTAWQALHVGVAPVAGLLSAKLSWKLARRTIVVGKLIILANAGPRRRKGEMEIAEAAAKNWPDKRPHAPTSSTRASIPMNTHQKRFQIALSFPGEHRAFVEQVASCLASRAGPNRILYDKYYEAEFARPDLDTYLQRLYHDESELIAVFLCADYELKEWCGLEWRAIRDLIKKRQASVVMLLRFDNIEIPGLFSTDGYVWIADRKPQEVADLLLERMQINAAARERTPE